MVNLESIDPSWKGFYKISGIAWLLTALLFVGAALFISGAILDIALQYSFHATSVLGSQYNITESETLRESYIAIAAFAFDSVDFGSFLSVTIMNTGMLSIGFAMLAGLFSKKISYLIITGSILIISGNLFIIFPTIPVLILLLGFLISPVYMVLVGLRLYSIGRAIP